MDDDREFEFWIRRATREQKLNAILRGQRVIMEAQNLHLKFQKLEIKLEKKQMADFSKLEAEVAATRGAAESTKAFVAGLEAKILELGADMSDAEDQAKVEAFASDLAAIRATLPQAIVANPDTGGQSTGGANPAVD